MMFRRSPLGSTFGVVIAGAAAAALVQPAFADRPVDLSFQQRPGYARITVKWADGDEAAPKVTAAVANQVLVVSFDQKVTLDLEALKEALPDWAAVTRMDADGRTARIGLKQAARAHLSSSIDLAAIDLLPESASADPPDIVSPLVAKRAAEAEAKRVAAIPPPPPFLDVEVRGSHAGDSSRVAFYWPEKVGYKVVAKTDGSLKLLFARRARADTAYLRITPPLNLEKFDGENTDRGYLVTLTAKDGLPLQHYYEGDVVVIDITRLPPPQSEPDPEDPKAVAARPAPKPPVVKPEPVVGAVASKPPATGKPGLLLPPSQVLRDESAANAGEAAAQQVVLAQTVLGGPARTTQLAASWRDTAPKSGVVEVKLAPLASGIELKVTFAEPTAAATFMRGNTMWAVFAANADLRLDPTSMPAGYRVRTQRGPGATMLRIEAPRGMTISAEADQETWTLRLAPTAGRPPRFLKPERRPGTGGARIETMLVGAAGLVWFEDPVIGDQIAVAVAFGPASSSPAARDFVEALLPATAHGLAIVPKADGVVVTLEGEKVVVAMDADSRVAVAAETRDEEEPPGNAAFVDFAAWGESGGDDFFKRRSELEAAASSLDPASEAGADSMLNLARFYLGADMAHEALGVLAAAIAERPEADLDSRFIGARGAANVMAGRYAEGDALLSRSALRDDPSAALWRGLVAVERGEWERAGDYFRAAENELYAYPPDKAARFSAAWAEAALNLNDYDLARRHAEQARANGKGEDAERGALLLASLSAIVEGPAAAYPEFDRLSREASEPIAVRAELRRLELGVASGKLTANDAAGELESLRFRWRGDGVEMATVGILSDQYMRAGRFRDALMLAQSTALRDADAPGARDLRIKLTDYFRRLYLNGEADRLDPIQALALFYEFADLTPIGTDGDQMIRKLAQRLVAFDLLEPGAQLLQHQVDNRMRGVGKSAIAVDLARIYLMDKRPDRALAAINTTRQPSLPKELMLERRLLEAAAYLELGRNDHVVELVEPLEGVEAKSLLAEALWRDRKWEASARAYLTMLPPPGQAGAGDIAAALKGAIASRMSRDAGLISSFRRYAPIFASDPNKASFDLITAQEESSGPGLSEALRRVADAPRVDAFAAAMRQKLEGQAGEAKPVAAAQPPAARNAGGSQ